MESVLIAVRIEKWVCSLMAALVERNGRGAQLYHGVDHLRVVSVRTASRGLFANTSAPLAGVA
jgi:hypothetical protein